MQKEASIPLLDDNSLDKKYQAATIKAQFDKIVVDFAQISAYYDLLRGQNEYRIQQSKKGNLNITKGPNGEEILSSVYKIKKKGELDTYVRRGNSFAQLLKDATSNKTMEKAQMKEIKDIQKQYNKMYSDAAKQLDYIAKDLGKATNIQ